MVTVLDTIISISTRLNIAPEGLDLIGRLDSHQPGAGEGERGGNVIVQSLTVGAYAGRHSLW